jgi:hypothetical protein
MTKDDMVQVLRSVGVNENTVTAMCNAFDMGVAYEREACAGLCDRFSNRMMSAEECADAIRAKGAA